MPKFQVPIIFKAFLSPGLKKMVSDHAKIEEMKAKLMAVGRTEEEVEAFYSKAKREAYVQCGSNFEYVMDKLKREYRFRYAVNCLSQATKFVLNRQI